MARVKVVTHEEARRMTGAQAPGCETRAFISGAADPLHLRQHALVAGARLTVAGTPADRLGYVLDGEVQLGDLMLDAGSSFVVERCASATLTAGPSGAAIAEFHDAAGSATASERSGGRVHAMPRAAVPRTRDLGTGNEMGGAIHADAACPTCNVWLHENDFHAALGSVVPLHAHSEDEIIFVTGGSIRLGTKVYGPGTAIAVAADTLYAFDVPAGGLSFLNFRVGPPTATTQGGTVKMDEAEFWTSRVGKPHPVAVTGDTCHRKDAR